MERVTWIGFDLRDHGSYQVELIDQSGAIDGEQGRRIRLPDHIFKSVGAKPGVHRHDDRTDLRQGEESVESFRLVRHPQKDLVARSDAERDQPACDHICFGLQFRKCNAVAVMHKGFTRPPAFCCPVEAFGEYPFTKPFAQCSCSRTYAA